MASTYRRVASSETASTGGGSVTGGSDGIVLSSSSGGGGGAGPAGINSPRSDENSTATNFHVQRMSSRSYAERFMDKMIALAWVLLTVVVSYWTNFFRVVLLLDYPDGNSPGDDSGDAKVSSTRLPNKVLLQVVAMLIGINTVLLLYLIVYLPKVKGLTDSSAWPVYCPRVIPTMTITGVSIILLLVRATWPVWGFLSPLVIGIHFMGFLFALHFVPWF